MARNPDGPARLWGLAFLVEDLEQTASALGELLGTRRDAVQPGRKIATLRPEAGLGPAIAFMTPPVRSGQRVVAHVVLDAAAADLHEPVGPGPGQDARAAALADVDRPLEQCAQLRRR